MQRRRDFLRRSALVFAGALAGVAGDEWSKRLGTHAQAGGASVSDPVQTNLTEAANAANAEIDSLTAELQTADAEVATLTAENNDLQAQLDALKPKPLRSITGQFCWTSSMSTADLDAILALDSCAGVSAFARWSSLTSDETTYNWTFFDRAFAAADRAGKPVLLMITLGNKANGLPASLVSRLPASDWITADNATFPVFWSTVANEAHDRLLNAVTARYGANPRLHQLRATGYWSQFGEPWFMGGSAGKAAWITAYQAAFGQTKTFDDLRTAYSTYERDLWTRVGSRLPADVRVAMAAGDAFNDVDGTKLNSDPMRHPIRFADWSFVRSRMNDRAVGQFNGANAGDGASGYGVWLPAAFGPSGAVPGHVGLQPVGGVTQGNVRLTTTQFDQMLTLAISRRTSFMEVYGSDFRDALANPTGEIATSLNAHADGWEPS